MVVSFVCVSVWSCVYVTFMYVQNVIVRGHCTGFGACIVARLNIDFWCTEADFVSADIVERL